jgi:signal transduction histidine kinase
MEAPTPTEHENAGRRAVLDALGGFRVVLDGQLRVIDASREARAALGGIEELDHCEVARAALASGETVRGREDLLGAEGRREVPLCATPVRSPEGEVTGVLLSEEREPETRLRQELAERQEVCHTLFEEVPCYVSVQDRDYCVVHANRLFREHFGDPAAGAPVHCYELYKHRTEPCLPCPVARCFAEGKTQRSEEVVRRRSGDLANVLVVTAPLRDATGQVTQVIEMSTDITEIRKVQSQLEALGMLVGRIAHEIKGVLTGLDGGVYMVSTGMERRDRRRLEQGWEMVRRNVDNVRTLVLDILYYAKDREPQLRLASPIRVAEEVVQRFAPKAQEHEIEMRTTFDPAAIRFQIDVRAIQALLTNLLENALDACRAEPTRERHVIDLAVRDESEEVLYVVADDGVGMDREARERAFTAFFSSKGASGTGLGLHIAQRIASQHEGYIEVDSELGKGSTFTVHLPKRARKRKKGPRKTDATPVVEAPRESR